MVINWYADIPTIFSTDQLCPCVFLAHTLRTDINPVYAAGDLQL